MPATGSTNCRPTPRLTTPERPGRLGAATAILKEVLARNKSQGLNDVAAGLSFWAILSVFPAVLAFTSLLGSLELFIGSSAANELRRQITDFLNRTLPADSEITTTLTNIINQSRAGLAIIGLASAAWGMSKGFAGLFRGLALVEGNSGARYGIKGRLFALVLGLATLLLMTIVLLQIVVGPLLGFEKLLPGDESTVLTIWDVVRWPVLLVLVVVWLATLFHVGPGRSQRIRWTDRLPGAIFTTVAWLAVTFGFKLYVDIVGGANPVLGVLGGAIVSLTWLYLLAMTTLLGAELNAVLADRRRGLVPGASSAAVAMSTAAASAPSEPAPAPNAVGASVLLAALVLGRRRR
jgi:membrane protein